MKPDHNTQGLKLTEEEAYAMLLLCLTSPQRLDMTSEGAVKKLAEYCTKISTHIDYSDQQQVRLSVS